MKNEEEKQYLKCLLKYSEELFIAHYKTTNAADLFFNHLCGPLKADFICDWFVRCNSKAYKKKKFTYLNENDLVSI